MSGTASEERLVPLDLHRLSKVEPASKDIWTRAWGDCRVFQLIPGYPLEQDVWILPKGWMGTGKKLRLSNRRVNFGRAVPEAWSRTSQEAEHLLRRLKRIAVLAFYRTVRVGKSQRMMRPFDPGTWVKCMESLLESAKMAALMPREGASPSDCPDPGSIFADLTPGQMKEILAKVPTLGRNLVPRLNAFKKHGVFDDWPASDVDPGSSKEKVSHKPYDDTFTAAVATAAMWMIEDLGPDLLACWDEISRIDQTPSGLQDIEAVRAYRKQRLASWEGKRWTVGRPFPYSISVKSSDGKKVITDQLSAWPPPNYISLMSLVRLLQSGSIIVIALATGARDGELSVLPRDCLVPIAGQDLLSGWTFKLSDGSDGEPRHWPLPRIAIDAVRQQRRLAESLDPDGEGLFAITAPKDDNVFKSCANSMIRFCLAFSDPDGRSLRSICDGPVNLSRFRKTISRLAGLCLVGANMLLFDILGHRDPEMSVNYMLADPELQSEIVEIARAASWALAEDAVSTAEGNGGPAASGVRELAARLAPRNAAVELAGESLERAAAVLSMNGRVTLVRAHVLCTKAYNQHGPCTRRAGQPDAGACQADCTHRLELAAARQDHATAIGQILASIPADDPMLRPWWQEQLIAHLLPFKDLRDVMLMRPDVKAALDDADPALKAKLVPDRTA